MIQTTSCPIAISISIPLVNLPQVTPLTDLARRKVRFRVKEVIPRRTSLGPFYKVYRELGKYDFGCGVETVDRDQGGFFRSPMSFLPLPLLTQQVFESLDDESTQWWIENRFKNDLSISDQWKRNVTDPELVKKYTDQARDRLSIIQDLLQFNRDQGNGRTWLGGAYPSHADALLFGFYAFSRLNEDIKRLVWEHESLPLVRQWVKDVVSLVGEEELP